MVRRMFPSSVVHHHQRDRRVGIRMRFGSIIPTKRMTYVKLNLVSQASTRSQLAASPLSGSQLVSLVRILAERLL